MDSNLHIRLSEEEPPQALIPNQYMWDFVEYIAFQRVHVSYTYCDEHFPVSFPTIDRAGAQRLLDEWVGCAARS